jgi:hypothetical protein
VEFRFYPLRGLAGWVFNFGPWRAPRDPVSAAEGIPPAWRGGIRDFAPQTPNSKKILRVFLIRPPPAALSWAKTAPSGTKAVLLFEMRGASKSAGI